MPWSRFGVRGSLGVVLLAMVGGGCDGVPGGDGPDGSEVTRYASQLDGIVGNVELGGAPWWALTDDLYVTTGQDNAGWLLVGVDASAAEFAFAKRTPGTLRITDITPDGDGGFFVAGRATTLFAARLDASARVLWSMAYDHATEPLPSLVTIPGVFSHEGISNVHDGKIALSLYTEILVVDADTGTAAWRRSLPGNFSVQRLHASEDGLWMLGETGGGLLVVRLDWDGALIDARLAETVPGGFSFGTPIARDADFLVSYLFKDGPTRSLNYGILSLAPDGSRLDQWTYTLSGERTSPPPEGQVLMDWTLESEPYTLQPRADGSLWLDIAAATYVGQSAYERTHLAFPITDSGTPLTLAPATGARRMVTLDADTYMSLGEYAFTRGRWNTACAGTGVEMLQLDKVDAPLVLAPTPITLTVRERPVTSTPLPLDLTDLGPATLTLGDACPDVPEENP